MQVVDARLPVAIMAKNSMAGYLPSGKMARTAGTTGMYQGCVPVMMTASGFSRAFFSVRLSRILIPMDRMMRLTQLLNQNPDAPVILSGIQAGASRKAKVYPQPNPIHHSVRI